MMRKLLTILVLFGALFVTVTPLEFAQAQSTCFSLDDCEEQIEPLQAELDELIATGGSTTRIIELQQEIASLDQQWEFFFDEDIAQAEENIAEGEQIQSQFAARDSIDSLLSEIALFESKIRTQINKNQVNTGEFSALKQEFLSATQRRQTADELYEQENFLTAKGVYEEVLGKYRVIFEKIPTPRRDILPLGNTNFDSAIRKNVILDATKDFEGAKELDKGSEDTILQRFFANEENGGGGILRIVNRVLGVIGILYIFIAGIVYTFNNGNEENIEKAKKQIIWVIVGLIVISAAEFVGFEIFNPAERDFLSDEIIKPLDTKVRQVIRYIEFFVGGFFLMNMALTGFYLVSSGATGGERLEKEKKFFQNFLLGAVFILLAEVIIRVIGDDSSSIEKITIVNTELGGIINFILTFLAGAAVLMLIMASLYYVVSFGNEEQANQAKRIITGSIIGLVVAFSSYVLAQFLII